MIEAPGKQKTFENVGPCLYRYTATGTYYALVKVKGTRARRSLNTTDKPLAKRRLADLSLAPAYLHEIAEVLPG